MANHLKKMVLSLMRKLERAREKRIKAILEKGRKK